MRGEILYCRAFYLSIHFYTHTCSILYPVSVLPIYYFILVVSFPEDNFGEQIQAILFKEDGKNGKRIHVETH